MAEQATSAVGGEGIVWDRPGDEPDQDLRTFHSGEVHTLYVPYQGVDYIFCQKLGELGRLHWIEVRIQEGSHWDYALHEGGVVVDQFSTDPDYFHEPHDQAHLAGDAAKLAAYWRIPLVKIDRYLRPWGRRRIDEDTHEYILSDKAYPEDEAGCGNCDQFFDFVRALGGRYPDQEAHTIRLPLPRWAQPRRPWWRFWRPN